MAAHFAEGILKFYPCCDKWDLSASDKEPINQKDFQLPLLP